MNTQKRLRTIFDAMQKISVENNQPKPISYFVDGRKAYAELKDRNPIVMAIKTDGEWQPAW